jgi:hypothetical protein
VIRAIILRASSMNTPTNHTAAMTQGTQTIVVIICHAKGSTVESGTETRSGHRSMSQVLIQSWNNMVAPRVRGVNGVPRTRHRPCRQ